MGKDFSRQSQLQPRGALARGKAGGTTARLLDERLHVLSLLAGQLSQTGLGEEVTSGSVLTSRIHAVLSQWRPDDQSHIPLSAYLDDGCPARRAGRDDGGFLDVRLRIRLGL